MNIIERIDKIIANIDKEKLSNLFIQATQIALDLEDYELWLILLLNTNVFVDGNNTIIEVSVNKVLSPRGFSKEQQEAILRKTVDDFLKIRTIKKDVVFTHSIQEIELYKDKFEEFNDIQQKSDIDKLNDAKMLLQKEYLISQNYLINVLTRLRGIAIDKIKICNDKKTLCNSKDIFIIHGHDEAKRRELVSILKDDFNLNPIVLLDKPNKGFTIIEKFESLAQTCSYAFALFTPDDIVEKDGFRYFQPRPNVIFELGWFFAKLGRDRVCILNKEDTKNNIFSDLQGFLRYEFKKDVKERYKEIENELIEAKIIISK
ncbi:MAG: nucleotide-binding protein [Endomicrobiaceae bacterium]|nr:nucleotide-binding protein [Endomicrobiaceae bacterium]